MRRLLFVVVLAGCAHSSSHGPAWPADRPREGGESLAPREPAKSIAAAGKDDSHEIPADKPAEKPAEKPAVTEGGAPAAAAPAVTDEVITTDEIVIEVGGDD